MVDLVYDLWNYWSARVGRGRVMRDGDLELGGPDAGVRAKEAEQVGERHYAGEAEEEDGDEEGEQDQGPPPGAQMC